MPHTDDDTVLALAIRDLIEANKSALLIDDVLYGNHGMIPQASAAVVTAMGKRRQLAGVSAPGGRTQNELMVGIDLHWSKVGNEDTERQAADSRGTALESLIHEDTTVGGIIIHGFITDVDRGDSVLPNSTGSNSMFRTVRMMYRGTTKTYLSPPAAP